MLYTCLLNATVQVSLLRIQRTYSWCMDLWNTYVRWSFNSYLVGVQTKQNLMRKVYMAWRERFWYVRDKLELEMKGMLVWAGSVMRLAFRSMLWAASLSKVRDLVMEGMLMSTGKDLHLTLVAWRTFSHSRRCLTLSCMLLSGRQRHAESIPMDGKCAECHHVGSVMLRAFHEMKLVHHFLTSVIASFSSAQNSSKCDVCLQFAACLYRFVARRGR